MDIINLISPNGYIMTSRALLGMYGSDCALLMCELISEFQYYRSHNMLKDGYFYSTVENIQNMLFLNAHAQRKAIDKLVKDGVIEKKQIGCPPRRYIKINEEMLVKKVSEFILPPVPDYPKDSEFEPLNTQNLDCICEDDEPTNIQNMNLSIYNNNKNNNNKQVNRSGEPDDSPEEPYMERIREIVSYLNQKSGKNFRPKSASTVRFIKARLNEGFTVDDCKAVIDIKVKEWGNNKDMVAYVRPETLFGGKFESYLNSVPKREKPQEKKIAAPLRPLNEEWGI